MLRKIRSKYITNIIFDYLQLNLRLKIIKYTKKLQNLISIKKSDYKEYSQIIIDIIPVSDKTILEEKNIFINYISDDEKMKSNYHIYFDNSKKEKSRNYFLKKEKISKIKIYIDNNITSLQRLFLGCKNIQEINFINFNRKNITDMNSMFQGCSSLIKINFDKFKTNNVTDMNYMFYQCTSLNELNLSNFDTNNVINMQKMFFECRILRKIIFGDNFVITNVLKMGFMFYKCYSLSDIDISNFNFHKKVDMTKMFKECSKKLIKKVKEQNKNIKEEAFN